jgi:MFS family permease
MIAGTPTTCGTVPDVSTATASPPAARPNGIRALQGAPGATRLLVVSLLARIPLAALGVVLLVHARELTGSYAAAGVVTGAYAVAFAASGPLLGRLVDRRGQARVLIPAGAVSAMALTALAVLPADVGVLGLAGVAALAGASTPPLGPALRALWPRLLDGRERVHAAYALESGLLELTYILGPPLLLVVAAWSSRAAIEVCGVLLLAGSVAFALQPAPRAWRGGPAHHRAPGSALRAPGLRTLALATLLVGALLGAVEVAVTATAAEVGSTGLTGLLLGLWGLGSLVGGLAAAHRGPARDPGRALVVLAAALAVAHVPLALAGAHLVALGALLVLAGAVVAPVFAAMHGMIDAVARRGTTTEAFAWVTTSIGGGIAIGAPLAGWLTDAVGPSAGFMAAAAAGMLAAAAVALRVGTLPRA